MSTLRTLSLLALLAGSTAALAGQTLTGDAIRINYGDDGVYNWSSAGAGLEVDDGTGTWADVTYPGTPWALFDVEFTQATAGASEYYAHSYTSSDTLTVDSENDLSSGTTLLSVYEYTAGDLDIVKSEAWDEADQVVTVSFQLTNLGTEAITDLRFVWGFDPDTDYETHATYDTYNDVDDLDADGVDDWGQSVGTSSGWTVGMGSCQPGDDEFGHIGSWSSSSNVDADIALADYDGASGDNAMYWRANPGDLAVGETITVSTLLVFDTTEAGAQALALASTAACEACDADGDGFLSTDCGGEDCDDSDATISPLGTEVCDGADNDCDGDTDEDDATDVLTWYADADADGYGDAATTDIDCDQPSGYVDNADDCDDAATAVSPAATETCDGIDNDCDSLVDDDDSDVDLSTGTTWYADADADGYGDAATPTEACDQPSGTVTDDTDCDDNDANSFPGATETPYDGVDQDCSGADLCDVDADGEDATECGGDDCDDEDAAIHTGATETWYDGVDQDCDGASDDDADMDGFDSADHGGDDCDDADAGTNPGASETWYDGVDSDCDGASDNDADADGFDSADHGGDDCDDADAAIHPGATETWYDGIDQDCAGDNDDDADGDGIAADEDCDDGDASVNPGAEDIEDDGIDQDCDGEDATADEGDADGEDDGKGPSCSSVGAQTPMMVGALLSLVGLIRRRRD